MFSGVIASLGSGNGTTGCWGMDRTEPEAGGPARVIRREFDGLESPPCEEGSGGTGGTQASR